MRSARLKRVTALSVLACSVALVAGIGSASATFSSAPAPPGLSVGSATLAPPSSPGAADGCALVATVWIDLSWTATPSPWAAGYQIARSTTNGGPYSVIATVAGRTTTTYKDTSVNNSTTYYYVIRATKNAWTSANTTQVSDRTKGALCL